MVVLRVWGKVLLCFVVVIDLKCMLDLLWDYLVPNISNLSVLLDSICNFS